MASFVVLNLAPRALRINQYILKQVALKNCSAIWVKKNEMSSWSERKNSIATAGKSQYEIEVEKIRKKEKFQHYYGFFRNDTIFDEALMHFWMFALVSVTTFSVIMMCYGPDFKSQMRDWKKREAIRLIEEREAAGQLLINPDFAPPELIASMVPEEGDWEGQWLQDQPAIFSDSRPTYYTMVDTN